MTDRPGNPTPDSLADVFARQYLALDAASPSDAGDTVAGDAEAAWTVALDRLLARNGAAAAATLSAAADEGLPDMPPLPPRRCRLQVARAIDRWFRPLARGAALPPELAQARAALVRSHRLNADPALGQVIPRLPLGRRDDPPPRDSDAPATLSDAFDALALVPPWIEAAPLDPGGPPRRIRAVYRLLDDDAMRPAPPGAAPVVGIAPLAEAPADLNIRIRHDGGRRWYEVHPADLADRACDAIAALCAAGAQVILLPEMTLRPEALATVRQAVAAHGPRSALCLAVLGTMPAPCPEGGPPYNEAVLLNHRGEEIARQRKLHRWNLEPEQQRRYGLAAADGTGTLHEAITPGDTLLIVEHPGFGRFATMICEDLGCSGPGDWLRSNLVLDWVFTPVLDGSLEIDKWEAAEGRQAARSGIARIVVADSLPMTHRMNAVNAARGAHEALVEEAGVGLCVAPSRREGEARHAILRASVSAPPPQTRTIEWTPGDWPHLPAPDG